MLGRSIFLRCRHVLRTPRTSRWYATTKPLTDDVIESVHIPLDENEANYLVDESSSQEDFNEELLSKKEFQMVAQRTKLVGQDLLNAFQKTGFAYVSANFIDPSYLSNTLDLTRRFFEEFPQEAKSRLFTENSRRGYYKYVGAMHDNDNIEAFNMENDNAECVSELRRRYYAAKDFPSDLQDKGRNMWPTDSEFAHANDFRQQLNDYFVTNHTISQILLVALSEALGMHPTNLSSKCSKADHVLELKRYNAMSSGTDVDRLRSHKDLSMLSLLLQDRHGGLEVLHNELGWINTRVTEGALLVNVGDILERVTEQKVLSTPHRVRFEPSEHPRHSIVCFTRANWDEHVDKNEMVGDMMPL